MASRWAASFSSDRVRRLCSLLCWLALLCSCLPALAGVLTRAELVKRFPAPLMVGEKQADIPVWPLFKQNATATELVGYVFESIDLTPIPGFAGVPINLLVAIDPKGSFLDVAVLSHHEPVFLDGLGEAPLFAFVGQYKNLSLKQNINIDSKTKRLRAPDAGNAYLDGVSKATASVRIINQSVLSAALKVSRKKLGFAQGGDPDQVARIKPDFFETQSVQQLLDAGLIAHLRVTNRDVEKLFAGSPGAGLDAEAVAHPDTVFIDLYLALASLPTVGRNVLTEASWNKLHNRLEEGDHALLVMSSGRYSILADDFIRGSVPERLVLKQDKLPVDMRDLDMEMALAGTSRLAGSKRDGAACDQPGRTRSGAPVRVFAAGHAQQGHRLPGEDHARHQFSAARARGVLRRRGGQQQVLARHLEKQARRVAGACRRAGAAGRCIGHAKTAGRQWHALRLVPSRLPAVHHWLHRLLRAGAAVDREHHRRAAGAAGAPQPGIPHVRPDDRGAVGFHRGVALAWGRGTFCGWLCPFGALQEATGKLAQWFKLPQLRIRARTDARLKLIKYPLLAAILVSALVAPELTDKLVEFEPFKTAITLNFVRSWPYVAYAVGLLLASMFVYKFFCRYLCPFGAALALLGRFRLFDWIPRRAECGTPCQTCRHRCDYQAITPAGAVSYDECFQCMDCVVIYSSDEKCAPLMLEVKRARTIPIAQRR